MNKWTANSESWCSITWPTFGTWRTATHCSSTRPIRRRPRRRCRGSEDVPHRRAQPWSSICRNRTTSFSDTTPGSSTEQWDTGMGRRSIILWHQELSKHQRRQRTNVVTIRKVQTSLLSNISDCWSITICIITFCQIQKISYPAKLCQCLAMQVMALSLWHITPKSTPCTFGS